MLPLIACKAAWKILRENDTNFTQRLQCSETAMCFLQKWRSCASSLLSNIVCHKRTKVKHVLVCFTENLKKRAPRLSFIFCLSLSLPPTKMLRQTSMGPGRGINLKKQTCAIILILSFPRLPYQIYTPSGSSSNKNKNKGKRRKGKSYPNWSLQIVSWQAAPPVH